MEAQEIFTFCQDDLQSKSFAVFEEMKRKGKFCDMTIKIQNQSITAHRIIVTAGIPYFELAFDCSFSETEEKEIGIQDDLDPSALESLILFAYTSKLDITLENVNSLIMAAQFLQLVQVVDVCVEFLSKRIDIHNAVQVRELAINLKNSRLIDSCNGVIRKNFEDFAKTQDFLSLSLTFVKELVSDDDLEATTEEVVFAAVMRWIKFLPSERQVALPELLAEIRMIYLPVHYLINRVETEELIRNSEPCRDLINEVKNFYLIPEVELASQNLNTRPRNSMANLYAICLCEIPRDSWRILSLINNKWFVLASMDYDDNVDCIAAVNGKIYSFQSKTVLSFDPSNKKWEKLELDQEYDVGTCVVSHEGRIYCFGFGSCGEEMAVFDIQSNEWSDPKDMKTVRYDAAAASLGEFIYVTGGYDGLEAINAVEKYCPSTDEWTDAADMLVKRNQHGCTSMTGKIYVCGGTDVECFVSNSIEVYDPIVNQWNFISSMKCSKNIVSLVPHAGGLYAFGQNQIEVYDPKTDKWKICPSLSAECAGAVAISLPSIHCDPN